MRIERACGLEANAGRVGKRRCDLERRHAARPARRGGVRRIDVRRREPRCVVRVETRIDHAERRRHELGHRVFERLVAYGLDQRAEHVGRERVRPRRAGLVQQRHARDAAQVLGKRDARAIHAVGHAGARIRAVRVRFEKTVAEARRVRQQLPRGDARGAAAGQRGRERGQPARDARVEIELARRDSAHRRRRHDQLRYRREPEQRVLAHRHAGLAIGEPRRAPVSELAAARDEHDRADQAPLRERGVDRRVDPLAERGPR
nr:beta-lactamase domain protein [Burkholderia pseudomallei]